MMLDLGDVAVDIDLQHRGGMVGRYEVHLDRKLELLLRLKMVPRNAGRDLLKVNAGTRGENPEANTTDFFIVILTGEESIWLPRPFLSGTEPRTKTFCFPRGPNYSLSRL